VKAVGDDRVFLHGRIRAEGRVSGVGLEGNLYQCFWLRHGRFIRAEDRLTAKGARHALGLTGESVEIELPEPDASAEAGEALKQVEGEG
jgi:hypothetical protein